MYKSAAKQQTDEWGIITIRQCTYKRDIEARSSTYFCLGKITSTTKSECVFVALVLQHANASTVKVLSVVKILVTGCLTLFEETFADYVPFSFNTFFHTLLVPYFITAYMVVCFHASV